MCNYYCLNTTYFGQQLIIDLLSQLQQALFPSCQQLRETTEASTAPEGGNDVDLDSTKRSHAEEPLRCPHSDCEARQAYGRRDHLLRHYKTRAFLDTQAFGVLSTQLTTILDVVCDVVCECGNTFDYVNRFEKHIQNCQITQGYKGGIVDREKEYMRMLGTRKILTRTASQALNEQLARFVRCSENIRYREHYLQMNQKPDI